MTYRWGLYSLLLCGMFGQANAQVVVRGPYLQIATDSSILIRWRTDVVTDGQVWYGTDPSVLDQIVTSSTDTVDHQLSLECLTPQTTYYYAVGNSSGPLAGGDSTFFFQTHDAPGTPGPYRFWILGDCGTANANAAAVRDAYYNYVDTGTTDGILMLGDNAYNSGTDAEYQGAVFDMYTLLLQQTALWPTPGNHDYGSGADATTQTGPYYDIFTLPKNAEAGGLASGTEAYYSFDIGNVHFISLDSHDSDRDTGGVMLTWLENDLMSTLQEWIVVFFHHPAYTKGSHDSDSNSDSGGRMVEMRENVLPILEAFNVDLVLSGHSHSYERSFFIHGHYGHSTTFDSTMLVNGGDGRTDGTGAYIKDLATGTGGVYITAGSSGKISGGPLNHPVMYYSANTLGSVVMEVEDKQLDLKFINSTGSVDDYLTLIHTDYIGQPPTVEITQPMHNTYYSAPQLVTITADAQDTDGTLESVEFFVGGSSIGVDNTAPYTVDWTIPADGIYLLSAQATDDSLNVVPSGLVKVLVGTITMTAQISGGDHDAEENENTGSVNFTSTDLELSMDGPNTQKVGMHFLNPGIPKASQITNAYIQFTVDETNDANPCNLAIHGEYNGSASPFTTADFNISSRLLTDTAVLWAPPAWENVNDAGPAQATPNLAPILQEILGHPAYSVNSPLAFVVSGSGRRVAESYNGDSGESPELIIEYEPCPAAGMACDDGDPNTFDDQQDGFCNCIGIAYADSIVVAIASGSDDVEENGTNGSIYFNSSDIELVHDGTRGNQVIGLRFRDLPIPQGSFINHAYLQFTVDEADIGTNLVAVQGEDTDNAQAFTSATNDVSNRPPTTNSRSWSIPPWSQIGADGYDQRTPELRWIVREIIGRPGWSQGNEMVFLITGSGSKTAESYEGSAASAARLHVSWDTICALDHILFVDHSATGKQTGKSWTDALSDPSEALLLAQDCPDINEIWVRTGTYYPTSGTDRTLSFSMPDGVAVFGGFNGTETLRAERDPTANLTILSGDIGQAGTAADNSFHVVTFAGQDSATIDGFLITGGQADGVGAMQDRGAGVLVTSGTLTMTQLTIADCVAVAGAHAIFATGAGTACILSSVMVQATSNGLPCVAQEDAAQLILQGNNSISN